MLNTPYYIADKKNVRNVSLKRLQIYGKQQTIFSLLGFDYSDYIAQNLRWQDLEVFIQWKN
jgi:hypothetical protein